MIFKLISTKCWHTRFDPTSTKCNEDQANHGQSTGTKQKREKEKKKKDKQNHFAFLLKAYVRDWLQASWNSSSINLRHELSHPSSIWKKTTHIKGNSHVHWYIIGKAIPVVICQVIYGAHRHDCLPNSVDNGQGDDGPVIKRRDEFLDMLTQLHTYSCTQR